MIDSVHSLTLVYRLPVLLQPFLLGVLLTLKKRNITYVGSSPDGHNIWEFNYIGDSKRYRGAMAQEVAKINPMAVGIAEDSAGKYLTVDYSKIDVDMVEV